MKKDLIYNGHAIHVDSSMLCLTDMWRAAGSPDDKRPSEWARYAGRQFIEFIAENLNVGSAHIEKRLFKKVRGGRNPGTWAHWQIGFAYAKYLSPEFHAWCNEIVRDHMMGLARRSAIREEGKRARNNFTSVLMDHGVTKPIEFGGITNKIYMAIWDKPAAGLREQFNLPKKANLREHMSEVGLGAVLLSEALASERIVETNQYGFDQCAEATHCCASIVRKAIAEERASRQIASTQKPGEPKCEES